MALRKTSFGRLIFLSFILSTESVMLGKRLRRSSSLVLRKWRKPQEDQIPSVDMDVDSHQPAGSGSWFSYLLQITATEGDTLWEHKQYHCWLCNLLFSESCRAAVRNPCCFYLINQCISSTQKEYVLLVTFSNFHIDAVSEEKITLLLN